MADFSSILIDVDIYTSDTNTSSVLSLRDVYLDSVLGLDVNGGRTVEDSVKTWGRACELFFPGSVVYMAAGDYGSEPFNAPWPASEDFQLTVDAGEGVVFFTREGDVVGARMLGVSYWNIFGVEVRRSLNSWEISNCDNCTFRGVRAVDPEGRGFFVNGSSDMQFDECVVEATRLGADNGSPFSSAIADTTEGGFPTTNIYDGNSSTEWRSTAAPSVPHIVDIFTSGSFLSEGIVTLNWGSAPPKSFSVSVLRGVDFIQSKVIDNNVESSFVIPFRLQESAFGVSASMIRVEFLDLGVGETYFSLAEVTQKRRVVGLVVNFCTDAFFNECSLTLPMGVGFTLIGNRVWFLDGVVVAQMLGTCNNSGSENLSIERNRMVATRDGILYQDKVSSGWLQVNCNILTLVADLQDHNGGEGTGFYSLGSAGSFDVQHNTFYDFARGVWAEEGPSGVGNGFLNTIRSNVFIRDISGLEFLLLETGALELEVNYNLYHSFQNSPDSLTLFRDGTDIGGTVDYLTLALWISGTGFDANSLDSDPGFVSEKAFRDLTKVQGSDIGGLIDSSPLRGSAIPILDTDNFTGYYDLSVEHFYDALSGIFPPKDGFASQLFLEQLGSVISFPSIESPGVEPIDFSPIPQVSITEVSRNKVFGKSSQSLVDGTHTWEESILYCGTFHGPYLNAFVHMTLSGVEIEGVPDRIEWASRKATVIGRRPCLRGDLPGKDFNGDFMPQPNQFLRDIGPVSASRFSSSDKVTRVKEVSYLAGLDFGVPEDEMVEFPLVMTWPEGEAAWLLFEQAETNDPNYVLVLRQEKSYPYLENSANPYSSNGDIVYEDTPVDQENFRDPDLETGIFFYYNFMTVFSDRIVEVKVPVLISEDEGIGDRIVRELLPAEVFQERIPEGDETHSELMEFIGLWISVFRGETKALQDLRSPEKMPAFVLGHQTENLGMDADDVLPPHVARMVVFDIVETYKKKGTREALVEFIKILTTWDVRIQLVLDHVLKTYDGFSPSGGGEHHFLYDEDFDHALRDTEDDPFSYLYGVLGQLEPRTVIIWVQNKNLFLGEEENVVVGADYVEDSTATFVPGYLVGSYLSPNRNQRAMFRIIGNTATKITVELPSVDIELTNYTITGRNYFILTELNWRREERVHQLVRRFLPFVTHYRIFHEDV